MSAVATPSETQGAREICKTVKDFDNYEELEVDTAAASVMVLRKDFKKNPSYPVWERLIVNLKTRKYYHVKVQVSRYEYGGGKIREETALTVNNTMFYENSISSKAVGMQSGDYENATLTEDVNEAMLTCCKWCGVENEDWTVLASKLDIDTEYSNLFEHAHQLAVARDRAKREEDKLRWQKMQEEKKAAEAVKAEEEKKERELAEKLASCKHNTVDCTHGVMKKRCYSCRKKLGLNGFDCACGKLFCSFHQAPLSEGEDMSTGHLCDYDHTKQAQTKLLAKYSKMLDK